MKVGDSLGVGVFKEASSLKAVKHPSSYSRCAQTTLGSCDRIENSRMNLMICSLETTSHHMRKRSNAPLSYAYHVFFKFLISYNNRLNQRCITRSLDHHWINRLLLGKWSLAPAKNSRMWFVWSVYHTRVKISHIHAGVQFLAQSEFNQKNSFYVYSLYKHGLSSKYCNYRFHFLRRGCDFTESR